jgi:hypothetical protein
VVELFPPNPSESQRPTPRGTKGYVWRPAAGRKRIERDGPPEDVLSDRRPLIVGVLVFVGVGLLALAVLLPPPCPICSMGIWPKPFLSFVGVALVLAGVVVWGIRRPEVMLGVA